MVPIPKPPIICYDLQTNSNARAKHCNVHRLPLAAVPNARSRRVTIIQKDISELTNTSCPTIPCQEYFKEQNEERRRNQLDVQRKLDEINLQLKSLQRIQENYAEIIGAAHQTPVNEYDNQYRIDRRYLAEPSVEPEFDFMAEPDPEPEAIDTQSEYLSTCILEPEPQMRNQRKTKAKKTHSTLDYSENLELYDFPEEVEGELDDYEHSAPLYTSKQAIFNHNKINASTNYRSQYLKHNHHQNSPDSISSRAHSQSQTESPNILPESPDLLHELAEKYSFYKKDPKQDVTIELTDDEFFNLVEDGTMLEARSLMDRIKTARAEFKNEPNDYESVNR